MSTSDGTLEDYFRVQTPPSRGVDIIRFWEALFSLLDELKELHSCGSIYQNFTPENVRCVKDDSDNHTIWSFRISNQDPNITGKELSNYDPPEVFMSIRHGSELFEGLSDFSSAADIWSLGCIYSEASIWIADGYAGLQDYRHGRQTESKIARSQRNYSESPFHNGTAVLQSVLDAHMDINDRLRRCDNITKNVLETMVQEMLWEEDRPSAKALLRKSEVVLRKARQKSGLGAASAGENEMTKPRSRQNREYPPPSFPSPTQPLPPVPKRAALSLAATPRTAAWEATTPTDWDVEINRSAKQQSDPSRTTHTFPNLSHRPTPNQGRPRALPAQASHESLPNPIQRQNDKSNHYVKPSGSHKDLQYAKISQPTRLTSPLSYPARNNREKETPVPTQAASFRSSQQSSIYSPSISSFNGQDDSFLDALSYVPTPEESPQEAKPSKRSMGFSLFPSRSRNEPPPYQRQVHDINIPQSPPLTTEVQLKAEYISLNTCLEWKKANKKVKKHANVPPLLSPAVMKELSERDHAFIVDDSSSMAPVWADVQRVFEALSYVVKGMSPEGTELFFTVSYDTYLRKDTTELCTHLSNHPLAGQTNILYRLNLQLQAYRIKLLRARTPPKSKSKKSSSQPFTPAKVRPLSVYILTNGEWTGSGDRGVDDVREVMKTMGEFLKGEGLDSGSVSVQFVSFASGGGGGGGNGSGRMTGLGNEYGGNMGLAMDCERWMGNVVGMLKGAVDAGRGQGGISELA